MHHLIESALTFKFPEQKCERWIKPGSIFLFNLVDILESTDCTENYGYHFHILQNTVNSHKKEFSPCF